MYAECPSVVSPPQAKGRGIRCIGRRDKWTLPESVRSGRLENALLDREFFVDLLLNFLWWLDEFLRNGYRRGSVGASNDRDVDSFIAQGEGIVAGRSVQIHPGKSGERVTIGPEFDLFAEPASRARKRPRLKEYRGPVKNRPRTPSHQRVLRRCRRRTPLTPRFILWRPCGVANLGDD